MTRPTTIALIVASALAVGPWAVAQDAIVRTPLQKSDFPGDQHATHLMVVTVAPGGFVAPHTHPGIEMGYIQEGEAVMSIQGQPDRNLKPGDSYLVPAGTVHSAKVTGKTSMKIIATFVVDKSKPIATPVK